MELKEFITKTLTEIVEGVADAQSKHFDQGILINPPTFGGEENYLDVGGSHFVARRVQQVHFDVGIITQATKEGGAKAGIRIFSAEVSANGAASLTYENANRISFSVPVTFKPTELEEQNRLKSENYKTENGEKSNTKKRNTPSGW